MGRSHRAALQVNAPASTRLPVTIRSAREDEMPYLRAKFAEGVKLSSNALARASWSTFKRDVRPRLYACLDNSELLVADSAGDVAGWMAVTRGRYTDTVHWLMTRHPVRRHRVATQLLDSAGLRDRIVYTHRGTGRSDEWMSGWLARRGAVSVIYEPYERWK